VKKLLSSRFFSNSLVYTASAIVNRAIPFLLLPILTRHLDPEDFGRITIFLTLQVAGMLLSGLCLNSVLMQRYFKMAPTEFTRFLKAAYLLILLSGALVSLGLVAAAGEVTRLTNLPIGWVLIANACAMLGMVQAIGLTLLQMRQQAGRYGVIQVVGTVANALLSILLVVQLEQGWQGRIEGILVSLLIAVGWLLFTQWRDGDLPLTPPAADMVAGAAHPDAPALRTTMAGLRLGLPLVPGAMIIWGTTTIDRFFLNTQADSTALGVYAVGMMFAQVVEIISSTVNHAFMPIVYSRLNGSEADRHKLVQWTYALFATFLVIALAWSTVGGLLLTWLIDARYHGAVSVLTSLALGYAFNNASSLMAAFILNKEKNALVSAVSLLPFAVSVSLNWLLVPTHGIHGAAWAFLSATALNFVVMFAIAWRTDNLPWFSLHAKNT
jgi:O-antigen/teichoic acid export membrane protein